MSQGAYRRDCPACDRATAHDFLYAKAGCGILRCTACGLGRSETEGFDAAAYYTSEYFSGGHADGYADYVGAEAVLRREFRATLAALSRHVGGGRLLEIGCAYGFFLDEARAVFDVAGIELAPEAAAHARALGLDVTTGMADAETLGRFGRFDAIVLLDVIEHLPDPRATLALCADHLAPGGVMLITTGDFGSVPARLLGRAWRLMTPPQHLWFFTRAAMAGLAAPLGLDLAAFTHPWKTVPTSLIAFQLRRMIGLAPKPAAAPSRLGIPVNLFDAMRVVLRKPRNAGIP